MIQPILIYRLGKKLWRRNLIRIVSLSTILVIATIFVVVDKHGQSSLYQQSPHFSTHEKTFWENAEDPVAAFTGALALITAVVSIFQGRMLIKADRTAQRSVQLARSEFLAAHRPKIIVQAVHLHGGHDDIAYIQFTLINGGDSTATVTSYLAWPYVKRADAVFMPNFSVPEPVLPTSLVLDPGERVVVEGSEFKTDVDYWSFQHEGGRLFAVGRVEYFGRDKIGRITGFCREYKHEDGMWHYTDSPEEYVY